MGSSFSSESLQQESEEAKRLRSHLEWLNNANKPFDTTTVEGEIATNTNEETKLLNAVQEKYEQWNDDNQNLQKYIDAVDAHVSLTTKTSTNTLKTLTLSKVKSCIYICILELIYC